MDGVGAVLLGQLNDAGDVQIGPQGTLIFADQIGFVGGCAENAVRILIGIDRDGLQAQIVTGTEDPHCNLAAVCHQHFFEHFAHKVSSSFI